MLAASLAAAVLGAPAKAAEKADSNPNLHFAENRFASPAPPLPLAALAFPHGSYAFSWLREQQ